MKKTVFLAIALVCLMLCQAMRVEAASTTQTIDMEDLSSILAKHRGKVVLLNFFATWCPPCRLEIPDLVRLNEKYAQKGLVIIGLSVDEDKSRLGPFMQKMGIGYQVFATSPDIHRAYRISTIPTNVIYDRKGRKVADEQGLPEPASFEKAMRILIEGGGQ